MDGDGILNIEDEDMDGDGVLNGEDNDPDDDGLENPADGDDDNDTIKDEDDKSPQGYGTWISLLRQKRRVLSSLFIPQVYAEEDTLVDCVGQDEDVDGDRVINMYDPDIDGDGIPNGQDPDVDGD